MLRPQTFSDVSAHSKLQKFVLPFQDINKVFSRVTLSNCWIYSLEYCRSTTYYYRQSQNGACMCLDVHIHEFFGNVSTATTCTHCLNIIFMQLADFQPNCINWYHALFSQDTYQSSTPTRHAYWTLTEIIYVNWQTYCSSSTESL